MRSFHVLKERTIKTFEVRKVRIIPVLLALR